jgi:hypothetical protein
MATLKLNRGKAPAESAVDDPVDETPRFDPDANTGEVGGIDGVKYVQGPGHLFNARKAFVRTDPAFKMEPLTDEQERNRRKQANSNKRFFISANPKIREAGIPQQVLDAEKENARARAAEQFAA